MSFRQFHLYASFGLRQIFPSIIPQLAASAPPPSQDYRTGPITMESFDQTDEIEFTTGRTHIGHGILKLFRETSTEPTTVKDDVDMQDCSDGTVVCVLAVPSFMSAADYLAFIGPARSSIMHVRILRDNSPHRFMAIMKLKTIQDATDFIAFFNGKEFHAMSSEVCHVVRIRSIVFRAEPSEPMFPHTLHSPTSLAELPTCPVCLERMDATVTGLLTTACRHTFHCKCLGKWGDNRCPVCRYTHSAPPDHADDMTFGEHGRNTCSSCSAQTNLWMCLICGHIGCGRYEEAHAWKHHVETQHLYALDMDTQRVWDYAGDCYVHRLIQNRADGKLVEVPEMPFVDVEKSDKMAIEYSHLMTTQLDSQRQYYETELERAYAQAVHVQDEYQHKLDHETAQWKTLQTCVDVLTQENNTLKNKLKEAMRDNKQLHAKLDKAEKALVEQAKKLEEEALMNQLLRQNQVDLKKLIDARDADVQDLQEQVRDLMVFLETRDKIEKDAEDRGISASELQQATIMTVPSKTKKKKKNK